VADCISFYDELRFDTRNPEFTSVSVFIRCEGDCPFFMHGWHRKDFAKSIPTQEIFNLIWTGQESPMEWDRVAPAPVLAPVIFNPWDRIPVPVEQLVSWRVALNKGCDQAMGDELAEQINGHLTSVPQWDKCCPTCQAHDMMMQVQRNPPQ